MEIAGIAILIGWDEILEGDVTPTATIMSWRGAKGGPLRRLRSRCRGALRKFCALTSL